MKLHEELYFEITLSGKKSELSRFVSFLNSGELDEFFEISSDYVIYDDGYAVAGPYEESEISVVNDEYGIELSDFDPEDFLSVFCKAAKNLEVSGYFYDIDDEEFRFSSPMGDPCFTDGELTDFNDELDEEARREELEADDNYY